MNLLLFLGIIIITLIFIASYIELAKRFNIVDKPDTRRNHKGIIARGCGVVLVGVVSTLALILVNFADNDIQNISRINSIIAIFAVLGVVFFIEDVKSLRREIRMMIQIICAILGALACEERVLVFSNLPYFINFGIVVIGWIWFMNLYNFMDGIDGMTAINTIFFSIAVIFFTSNIGALYDISLISYCVLPVMIAFLIKNWHPAKVFIGDSGSIAFGFLFGYIMLSLSSGIGLLIPIIICSYYLCDASFTLIKRIIARENITLPHSKHYFQIALRGGLSVRKICTVIIILNLSLFCIAYLFFMRQQREIFIIASLLAITLNYTILKYFKNFEKRLTR